MSRQDLPFFVRGLKFFAAPDGRWSGALGGGGFNERMGRKSGAGASRWSSPVYTVSFDGGL